jgi:UDP-GlcNAc:undecaprenyl-phosphate GlcNAc-1-phosphate transferase
MNWLILFLFAFSLASFFSFLISRKFAKKNKKFFRIGGTAIILSFLIVFLLNSKIVLTADWKALLLGSCLIFIFGLWDDFKGLDWKIQLFFQILLALILIWFGYEIKIISFAENELLRLDCWNLTFWDNSFSFLSSIFIIFWLVGIINAVNWLDGSDGLLSTAGALSLIAVFFTSLRPEVNQPALSIISLIGVGSLLGFLIFNFPKAQIEAGTSGSYFVGFLLGSLAIVAGTKITTTMVVLILPVTDFVWVIFERIKAGQSIFKRDKKKRHLHYKLLAKGFSPRKIFFIYAIFLTIALLMSFFVANQIQKIFLLGIEFLMIILFMTKISSDLKNIKKDV